MSLSIVKFAVELIYCLQEILFKNIWKVGVWGNYGVPIVSIFEKIDHVTI